MESATIVDGILTAILQWRVNWLVEQKNNPQPPPICRAELKKLKITYDNYKDYESTFVPLIMHEIWAQIYEEWTKIELEQSGGSPMDIDEMDLQAGSSNNSNYSGKNSKARNNIRSSAHNGHCPRQFWIGIASYRSEGQYQCLIKCQYLVDSKRLGEQLKLIGEGDLVVLDLVATNDAASTAQLTDDSASAQRGNLLNLFGYVIDVTSEKLQQYTTLANCFVSRRSCKNLHVINYSVVIAKRPLRLNLSEPMKISGIYYLKPMIRQIESIAILRESVLASDILNPKLITCKLSLPTVVDVKSPYYNTMQFKAIIGANEALVRNTPKIQLIQGPPGTGKTHTLIGIIKQFYSTWPENTKMPKVLICAPSNGAIDEVARRLFKEREFLKATKVRRSLRLVRVGHPDQISDSVKAISLEELVEVNANSKVEGLRKKMNKRTKDLEEELIQCDTEITNLRYLKRLSEIPALEMKIAKLITELDSSKNSEDLAAKREASEAAKKNTRYELIKNADVILTTLNSCQRQPLENLFKGDRAELSFHCVIVDEASQCCEPELLMPLCYRISRMILIGDPMQLPATVISRHAQDYDYSRSLFERFFIHFGNYSTTSPIAMLTDQYRMHPAICEFPSNSFYNGRLVTAKRVDNSFPIKPYIVFDLKHSREKSSSKKSIENEVEAEFVRNLLTAVLVKAPENTTVGVITPYKGQKRLITHKIRDLQSRKNIQVDVNTCDGFQGQERDIIILSCVRASDGKNGGSIGFLKSFQRINVALTRAKQTLILCVSTKSLTKDKTWGSLVEDACARQAIQYLTNTPGQNALVTMITKPLVTNAQLQQQYCAPSSKLVRVNFFGGQNETNYIMPMDID